MELTGDLLTKYGIPPKYHDAEYEKAIKRVNNPEKVEGFLSGEVQGLFIPGMNGCGKTYLSCAIMKKMMTNRVHCYRSDAVHLSQEYTGGNNWGLPRRFLQPRVLILDEVAKELNSSPARLALEMLITWRGEHNKQTILISNLGLTAIEEHYGPTIPSKIRDFFTPIRLPDEDLRKK